ncbi:MAG: hypothetical protein V4563_14845 [Pseudomonadota bacterium]
MSQMEISVKRSERLTHRLARPMIMSTEPTPATHALFDMGKELNALKARNETLDRELTEAAKDIAKLTGQRNGAREALVQSEEDIAALLEKYRCKCVADVEYAKAAVKAQTYREALEHERDELRAKLKVVREALLYLGVRRDKGLCWCHSGRGAECLDTPGCQKVRAALEIDGKGANE